jgi:uncharacterized protein GlcG (DUF336 family)
MQQWMKNRRRRPRHARVYIRRDSIAGGNAIFITFPGMVAGVGGFPLLADGKIIGGIASSGNHRPVNF